MCGLVGLILGRKRRHVMERVHPCGLFSRLIELNEPRGPHATGAAGVNRDGEHGRKAVTHHVRLKCGFFP